MEEIYQPGEDSYFFAEFLERYFSDLKNKKVSYLDMGCGSGIFSKTAEKFIDKKNIIAADVNSSAIKTMKNQGFEAIKTDLFSKIKGKFDIISFNAPYLPEDLREPKNSRVSTTGGKRGDEISIRFLEGAKNHLKNGGKIFLLISSLTPLDKINKFKPVIIRKKKIFFEELLILEIE